MEEHEEEAENIVNMFLNPIVRAAKIMKGKHRVAGEYQNEYLGEDSTTIKDKCEMLRRDEYYVKYLKISKDIHIHSHKYLEDKHIFI
ncbi:Hypothetical predicted protein [Octopus vulgaris]|uniref:Uncharacterized protein n=1 Tax=Octopus vulgaris TaxID=6645 RepID=A0AA36BAI0_OCTVU|nr:Hypothetical predicted protein [Octopus vulgaris]